MTAGRAAAGAAIAAALGAMGAIGPACALLAGLEEHTLEQPDGGAGGSTSSTGTTGGGGGGASPGWPDSSTAWCSDGSAEVPCPTPPGSAYHGQDGDVLLKVPSYAVSGPSDSFVTDSITGLTWRRAPLTPKTQADARKYCEDQSFGGLDDWRLPSRLELVSLVDFGADGALIDPLAFPDVAAARLWSATEHRVESPPGENFWSVDLGCTPGLCGPNNSGPGGSHGTFFQHELASLCVRGPALTVGPLTVAGTGVVTDPRTGLTWQTSGSASQETSWLGALAYCNEILNQDGLAEHHDWRLPSIKELQTLTDDTKTTAPAILTGMVVQPQEYIWSSTPVVEVSPLPRAQVLFTFNGSTAAFDMTLSYLSVRCVRGGED